MDRQLYLLTAIKSVGYDSYDGFVVSAQAPIYARLLANKHEPLGDETRFGNSDFWLDPSLSTCDRIGISSVPEGVVLSSFNAG